MLYSLGGYFRLGIGVSHKELTETEPVCHEHQYSAVSDMRHNHYRSSYTLLCLFQLDVLPRDTRREEDAYHNYIRLSFNHQLTIAKKLLMEEWHYGARTNHPCRRWISKNPAQRIVLETKICWKQQEERKVQVQRGFYAKIFMTVTESNSFKRKMHCGV